MQIIADLQLHSRFSRAVSKDMTIPNIAAWAARKGIGLVATGDWTHPLWMREIKEQLEEMGNGLLRIRRAEVAGAGAVVGTPWSRDGQGPDLGGVHNGLGAKAVTVAAKGVPPRALASQPLFLLATEVSCIYSQGGKVRRVHTLIWVPTLDSAEKINKEMTRRGCNLLSDGRPIIGLTSIQVAELVLTIEPKALIIPAHAWTPWFSVYGGLGGFDSIDEAFGPFAKQIYAVETGLSSSPSMNWRIKELDHRSIVSFSDAHSGPKLGREATVFEVSDQPSAISYQHIYEAISRQPSAISKELKADSRKLKARIAFTIEFYPEEGKYHYTGHRLCNIRLSPQDSKQKGSTCPVCGKPLTQGVMQRVDQLASRSEESLQLSAFSYRLSNKTTVQMIGSKAFPNRPAFVMLVPLQEIIAEAVGSPVTSPKVQTPYFRLTDALGGEFNTLLSASTEDIARVAGEPFDSAQGKRVAAGVEKVRKGDLVIDPGYDGVFGVVRLWREGEEMPLVDASREQLAMF